MKVLITSRKEKIFDGTCQSITSYNAMGEFDILEKHAHFISLITKEILIDKDLPNEQKIPIEKGVLKCEDNTVEIYITPQE